MTKTGKVVLVLSTLAVATTVCVVGHNKYGWFAKKPALTDEQKKSGIDSITAGSGRKWCWNRTTKQWQYCETIGK